MSKKAVIVISSHVARGSVGNRAAVFALETLGFPVWAIPTVTLPWHPGHGASTRIVADETAFAAFLTDIENAPWIDEVGAILTGYMANPAQVKSVAKLVSNIKAKNENCVYLCDPVIGDFGGLYIPQETAATIRDELIPRCDITTPNRFELSWLLDQQPPKAIEETIQLASQLGPEHVITTSCPTEKLNQTGNLYYNATQKFLATHAEFKDPPNGPGDLTAAIYLGHLLDKMAPDKNLSVTTSSVFEILQNATKRGSDELTLESDAQSIVKPNNRISLTDLT
jgi:pyridoxine kinase